MTEGDRAPVYICLISIETEFLLDRQVLRGERLIDPKYLSARQHIRPSVCVCRRE